jgi:lysylphosphatidylglycerol synthetase-like protein (DUF2156 family)
LQPLATLSLTILIANKRRFEPLSKDKVYGWLIAIITTVLFIAYTYITLGQWFLDNWMANDAKWADMVNTFGLDPITWLLIPVWAAGLLTWFIIAWIGYTMATTPPPEPIDLDELDLEEDTATEEE